MYINEDEKYKGNHKLQDKSVAKKCMQEKKQLVIID